MDTEWGRVLVLGLDVGDARLVETWARAGELPTLAGLLDDGAWGLLGTTAETLHVSAWPSLYTGASPGRHGVYYTHQPAPGEQGAVRFRADQYGVATVWEEAARAGRSALVFDAPYTHPVRADGLVQVFEWGTWAHYWTPGSAPPDRFERLERACGAYPLGVEANQIGLSRLDAADLVPRLVRAAEAKAEATRWLMEAEPAELVWVVFGETHPAAHYLWPDGRSSSSLASAPEAFDRLLEVYRAVDAGLGRVLQSTRDGDTVLVVSGDGVGANHAGWHLLPEALTALGYLVPPGGRRAPEASGGDGEAGNPRGKGSQGLYARLRGLVPSGLRQNVSRYLPARVRDTLMKRNQAAAVDWSATRVFCLPTDLEGCLRVNLRGREPEGIVAPGEEVERLLDELTERLLELENPETGRPAVADVVRTSERFPGERADRLPDLVVRWAEEAPIRALRSPRMGTLRAPSPDERTGTHRPPGFALARGPGFAPGSTLDGAHVLDVAPTVLDRLGVPAPPHVEGRAWGRSPG